MTMTMTTTTTTTTTIRTSGLRTPNFLLPLFALLALAPAARAQQHASSSARCRVTTLDGMLEGLLLPGGIRCFRGVPYAQPPLGELRWKAPRPAKPWKGLREAVQFGHRPMQNRIYSDMVFRSDTISEDCLYLNIWTPKGAARGSLPVLVYFYGGGFMAGDASEPRYDGAGMARKGIVAVTVNYRLGVFGFLALPALAKESPHHSSGNYGLLDQNMALRWVHDNIAAFGGDPARVTIAGQSAGSMSVSAQMASPLSKGLFAGAIGESGSVLGNLTPHTLAESEQAGLKFMKRTGAKDLAALRAMPAAVLLKISAQPGVGWFGPDIDGYFLPEAPEKIYTRGLQADVPLLAGWNSAEVNYHALLGNQAPTPENYKRILEKLYGDKAGEVLQLYPGSTEQEVKTSATALASDRFIAYATWKWIDLHGKTDGKPVYRYLYAHLLPKNSRGGNKAMGAPHSAEIPYALGNLHLISTYDWTAADYKVSALMQDYFAQFIKTGDPNGQGLPHWPVLQSSIPKVMHIDTNARAVPEEYLKRYLLLDRLYHHR
jgi:para-nitrobenzyl esterase